MTFFSHNAWFKKKIEFENLSIAGLICNYVFKPYFVQNEAFAKSFILYFRFYFIT